MHQKRNLLLALLGFVILLAGAGTLYNFLSAGQATENLVGGDTVPATTAPAQQGSDASGDASGADDENQDAQTVQAPDFTVYDADGDPVSLSDFAGTPVVLNFWASWCGPCQSEMPDFEQAYQDYGDQVQFLMVNATDGSRETVDTASAFVQEQGYTFPVYYDTDNDASLTYGVYALPSTYFIGADGSAVARASGALDAELLQKGLDMILPGT